MLQIEGENNPPKLRKKSVPLILGKKDLPAQRKIVRFAERNCYSLNIGKIEYSALEPAEENGNRKMLLVKKLLIGKAVL